MDADKPSLSPTLTPHAAHCFFPPNSVSTLRGSYGKPGERTGRCLIRVLQLVCGIFIYKLPHQSPHAFRLRRLAQSVGRGSGRRQVVVLVGGILPVKFLHTAALEQCLNAFRLRRLAQSMGRGSGRRTSAAFYLQNCLVLSSVGLRHCPVLYCRVLSAVPGLDLCDCARCSVPCFLRLVLSCLP